MPSGFTDTTTTTNIKVPCDENSALDNYVIARKKMKPAEEFSKSKSGFPNRTHPIAIYFQTISANFKSLFFFLVLVVH